MFSRFNSIVLENEHYSSNSEVEYSFCDFVVGRHLVRESVQVSALLRVQAIVSFVKDKFTMVSKTILQSDTVTCFASQNLISFIFHMNASKRGGGFPMTTKSIFTEAQTVRGRLDTHFTYTNTTIKSFVDDGNDIMVKNYFIKIFFYQDGVDCTTAALLNCHQCLLPAACLTMKKFRLANTSTIATHVIHWEESCVHVESASGMTSLEPIYIHICINAEEIIKCHLHFIHRNMG